MNNVNKLWIVNRIATFKCYNKSSTIKTKIYICKSQDDSKLRKSFKKSTLKRLNPINIVRCDSRIKMPLSSVFFLVSLD